MKADHTALQKSLSMHAEGKAKGEGALSRALLHCLAQWRLRNLEMELGGVMLPRLLKVVLGGVVKMIAFEAAKQRQRRTVKRQWADTVCQV